MNALQHEYVSAAHGRERFRTIRDAETLLNEGRRGEAAEICLELLHADPDDGDATNVLGLIAVAEGRDEAAVDISSRRCDANRGRVIGST